MTSNVFHELTKEEPPRDLAIKTLSYLDPDSLILDCGCGAGNDTVLFLNNGHRVIALDLATDVVSGKMNQYPFFRERVQIETVDVMVYEMPKISCFYASLVLSFLSRKRFDQLWQMVGQKLSTSGIVSVNVFGNHDAWYRPGDDMSFFTEMEFRALFAGYSILAFDSQQYTGTYMDNTGNVAEKHWHVLSCIARKVP